MCQHYIGMHLGSYQPVKGYQFQGCLCYCFMVTSQTSIATKQKLLQVRIIDE